MSDVKDALDRLAAAQNARELAAAHRETTKQIGKIRSRFRQALGPLAQTYAEGMTLWDRMKADGVPLETRIETLAKSLFLAWPKRREEPWHFRCKLCDDAGWRVKECTAAARCGRPFKLPKASADDWTGRGRCGESHTYVEPCLCDKGRDFRAQLLKERRGEDEMALAARTSKPSRMGRWTQ